MSLNGRSVRRRLLRPAAWRGRALMVATALAVAAFTAAVLWLTTG